MWLNYGDIGIRLEIGTSSTNPHFGSMIGNVCWLHIINLKKA